MGALCAEEIAIMSSPTLATSSALLPRSRLQIALAVLGCVGVLTPFLPFTWSRSPLDVFVGVATVIAAPFFLSILVSIVSVRVAVFERFSRIEAVASWIAAIVMSGATAAFGGLLLADGNLPHIKFWIALASCEVILVAGIALVVRLRLRRAPSPSAALTGMQCAYIANAVFCLIVFWPEWQIGAIFAAATVVLYAFHVVLLALPYIRSAQRG
jgi:hypothetical protein